MSENMGMGVGVGGLMSDRRVCGCAFAHGTYFLFRDG